MKEVIELKKFTVEKQLEAITIILKITNDENVIDFMAEMLNDLIVGIERMPKNEN